MRALVSRQCALVGVGLGADGTLEWLFARVQSHVLRERALQHRVVRADRTLEGTHSCKTRSIHSNSTFLMVMWAGARTGVLGKVELQLVLPVRGVLALVTLELLRDAHAVQVEAVLAQAVRCKSLQTK